MDATDVQERVAAIAAEFARDRSSRQLRRGLEREDFRRLADAGFLLTGVPLELGGLWIDTQTSTRTVGEILRTLARGDPSVALVSSMHPAVLSLWLSQKDVPEPFTKSWKNQCEFVAQTALDGGWWGTITSEPGSGGDVFKTRAVAKPSGGDGYEVTGQKHFGSGSGITSYMITTALPEGEAAADWFFMNVADTTWDGSSGMKLISEWDGHGMIATQSHAFEFSDYRAQRIAWPANLPVLAGAAGPVISSLFTAVIVGVTEAAFEAVRSQIFKRHDDLKPYEQTEWARVENEAWLMTAAYESMLRSVEANGSSAGLETLHAKTAVAELAESITTRICRVIGGGSFHRASPFGWAFEDVRALGFLRPPWSLAFEAVLQRTRDRLDQQA